MAAGALTVAFIGASGAVVGAAIGSFGSQWVQHTRDRKALRAAFRAEISSLLKIADARGLESLFQDVVDHFDKTGQEKAVTLWGFNAVHADPIFSANVGKIGLLGADVAEDIGDFYTLMNAVRVDLVSVATGQLARLQPRERIDVYRRSLKLWRDAKAVGTRLCGNL